jgi:hypothetical protein
MGEQSSGEDTARSDNERALVRIRDNRLYEHKKLLINYTSYDFRRCTDTVKIDSHPDIMVPADEDDAEEKFWYARVVGVYHVVCSLASQAEWYTKDVLFVRWFARNPSVLPRRLPGLSFFDTADEYDMAFGFINPTIAIRGVHIIPAFNYGKRGDLLRGPSIARVNSQDAWDWAVYNVNMYVYISIELPCAKQPRSFVDRDMFMRFVGGGVGHRAEGDRRPAPELAKGSVDPSEILEDPEDDAEGGMSAEGDAEDTEDVPDLVSADEDSEEDDGLEGEDDLYAGTSY